jgi:uncharacterized protein
MSSAETERQASMETAAGSGTGDTFTGNHYIALPDVGLDTLRVGSANVLHRGMNGLLEWAGGSGRPLIEARIDGEPVRIESTERVDHWLPRGRFRSGPLRGHFTVCAAGGFELASRGAVVHLELQNTGHAEQETEVAWVVAWHATRLAIRTARPWPGSSRLVVNEGAAALEVGDAGLSAALGFVAGGRGATVAVETEDGNGAWRPVAMGEELSAAGGVTIRLAIRLRIPAGRRVHVPLFLAAAPERDGALASARYLQDLGADEVVHLARLDLARIQRRPDEPALAPLLARNLAFCYYASIARGIDDDLLYPVQSRAPRHGATAVVSERAALLWSLPALTLADGLTAREALLRVFEQYSARPGHHLRYVDGAVLAPGFALDQVCAYVLALDRYVATTQDASVIEEPIVQDVLREIDETLFSLLHREVFLCASERLPSGESADQEYLTWPNALVWAAARALGDVWRGEPGEAPPRFNGASDEVAAAIWQRCTVDVDGLQVLGYATDLKGNLTIYDDPAGSLALLPWIRFCDEDDPIWQNTMDLLASPQYPLHVTGAAASGRASRARPASLSLAALCSDLLGPGREQALTSLRGLRMPDGIAAGSFDPATGEADDTPWSAPLAGFLVWAVQEALRARRSREPNRRERRRR